MASSPAALWGTFAAQTISLLCCLAYHAACLCIHIPLALVRAVLPRKGSPSEGAVFYEGIVTHDRRAPKVNSFRYPVRTAIVSLDNPPAWFANQAKDHMTANEARKFASTDGAVRLLTNPEAAGYVQNPISVYYCYSQSGTLERCIAEVSNTPWGERVTFVFSPSGEKVAKSMHVSPFMDMQNEWQLEAPEPGDSLRLVVKASHPQHGAYFHADLVGVRSRLPHARNEEAGLGTLLRYGFQPQRVALLIYWQAVKLIWLGVPLYSPPCKAFRSKVEAGARHPKNGTTGTCFVWREAKSWPWNVEL